MVTNMYTPTVYLIIFGGRDFTNWPLFERAVTRFIQTILQGFNVIIVEGEARGVDTMARKYAMLHGYDWEPFPADWVNLGKRAGFVRNHEMISISHYGLGFWDGVSSGTGHSVSLCESKGIPYWIVPYTNSL